MTDDLDLNVIVTAVTNQATAMYRVMRRMRSWYIFSDKRPGSILERFDRDAKDYVEYQRLFQPGGGI